jgi:hypothetical protein
MAPQSGNDRVGLRKLGFGRSGLFTERSKLFLKLSLIELLFDESCDPSRHGLVASRLLQADGDTPGNAQRDAGDS